MNEPTAKSSPPVVFATGIFPPEIGGPASYVSRMAEALHSRGWNVRVVTYGETEGLGASAPEAFPVERVTRHGTIAHRYLAYYRAVQEALRALGPKSLLFAQDPVSSGFPASLAARRANPARPVVLKIVGDLAWEIARSEGWSALEIDPFQDARVGGRTALLRWAERRVARSSDQVITPSRYLADMVERWGVAKENISVIHNAPPDTTPRNVSETRPPFMSRDKRWVASAGRMVPWKGFADLLRAVSRLSSRFTDIHLVLVGSGPEETKLKRLAEELGVEERVVFTGALPHRELLGVLAHADLFVLASRYEGFSHLLLEAMALGLPVVASNIGGNPELVRDRTDGILFNSTNPAELDQGLTEILQDDALRARVRANGKTRTEAFSWKRMLTETEAVLKSSLRQ